MDGDDLIRFFGSCPPAPGFPWARCSCGAPLRSDGKGCTGAARHPVPAANLALYATWTGTRANLAAMHAAGFRLLAGPDQLDRRGLPPLAYGLDNGAWAAFRAGRDFDPSAFREVLRRWGATAEWIVLPDIVAGGMASLALSLSWLDEVRAVGPRMLLPVQDGMGPDDVLPVLRREPRLGVFLGGSTAWKWATLPVWGDVCRSVGARLHVGRVNTAAAIRACVAAGATSADGTSASIYSVNAPKLAAAARGPAQVGLPAWTAEGSGARSLL